MKQILAYLMALVMGLMVACLLMRAVDEFFTLAWVGFYLILLAYIVMVWEDNKINRLKVHEVPHQWERSHVRSMTFEEIITHSYFKDYDPGLEYDLDHEEED